MKRIFPCPALLFSCLALLPLLLPLMIVTAARGQVVRETPKDLTKEPMIIRLTVDAAPEPNPALRYTLVPTLAEQKPGNGASFYYRALAQMMEIESRLSAKQQELFRENYDRWLTETSDPVVRKQAQEWAHPFRWVIPALKTAAYRETVDFDLRTRDARGMEFIEFYLPEVQNMRALARLLAIRICLAAAEGRPADAIEDLRLGYKMARDVGSSGTLVGGLVGLASEQLMNQTVLALISAPAAPNLYWAIANLPQPVVDMRSGMEAEYDNAEQLFPFLKDAESDGRTAAEWTRIFNAAVGEDLRLIRGAFGKTSEVAGDKTPSTPQQFLDQAYPIAKRELIAAGYDRQRIERMPAPQVVAIQTRRITRYAYDEIYKWLPLPYWQSDPQIEKSMEKLAREGILASGTLTPRGALPIAQALLSDVPASHRAAARTQRDRAALQTIEALRLHAAKTGAWPDSLDQLAVAPAPLNPVTGKSFPYEKRGNVAVLNAPIVGAIYGVRYEITLRKPPATK